MSGSPGQPAAGAAAAHCGQVLAACHEAQGFVIATLEGRAFVVEHLRRVKQIVFQLADQAALAQNRVEGAQIVGQRYGRAVAIEPLSVPLLQKAHQTGEAGPCLHGAALVKGIEHQSAIAVMKRTAACGVDAAHPDDDWQM